MTDEERHPSNGWLVLGFADREGFEAWLEEHADDQPGVWVMCVKKGRPVTSIDYEDSLLAALCFGWIDSMGRRYDDTYQLIRYQPRKAKSNWSASNKARIERLLAEGRMHPSGLAHVEAAKANGRWDA